MLASHRDVWRVDLCESGLDNSYDVNRPRLSLQHPPWETNIRPGYTGFKTHRQSYIMDFELTQATTRDAI
jgi:hypothetical protein